MNRPYIQIQNFNGQYLQASLAKLSSLLHACVLDGASINFVLPYSQADAERFWLNKVLPAVQGGKLLMLVAMHNNQIAGSVQLDYDTPPNQPHRAEVRKLLVHPNFRRQGIARLLMTELENQAHQLGRTLLTLDTLTGDKAEPLYRSLGYQTLGVLPDYCLATQGGEFQAATFMYKHL